MKTCSGAPQGRRTDWFATVFCSVLIGSLIVIGLAFYSMEKQAEQAATGCTSRPGHEPFRVAADRIVCLDKSAR